MSAALAVLYIGFRGVINPFGIILLNDFIIFIITHVWRKKCLYLMF